MSVDHAEDLLLAFTGKSKKNAIDGVLLPFYATERPLGGSLQVIDWFFGGQISYYIKKGCLTGHYAGLELIPLKPYDRTIWLILLGMGASSVLGSRLAALDDRLLFVLIENIKDLRLTSLGFFEPDFPAFSVNALQKSLSMPVVSFKSL
jgi:hypothetical protein